MKFFARFATADAAVDATIAAVAAISQLGSEATLAKGAYKVFKTSESLTRALDAPLVVFDIDDTLLRNDSSHVTEVVKLYNRLKDLGAKVHLVTARSSSMYAYTVAELKRMHITGFEPPVMLCPEHARKSMVTVSEWKALARQNIANHNGAPITLTIGDQWSDMIQLASENDLATLDGTFATSDAPYVLVQPNDGISLLGLKLKSE